MHAPGTEAGATAYLPRRSLSEPASIPHAHLNSSSITRLRQRFASGMGAARPRATRWISASGRVAGFWLLWSFLLLVHEGGHALVARHQDMDVARVTVGVGPVVWAREGETALVLRLVPLAGLTRVSGPPRGEPGEHDGSGWRSEAATLAGGALATLALVVGMAGIVGAWERSTGRRCLWGRVVIADALVLSVFNLLPVPPLDGGRAVLSAISALRGAPLAGDALFWLQLGGLTLAVLPLAVWTGWTRRIDAAALRWGAPPRAPSSRA